MFSRTLIMKSTGNYWSQIEKLKKRWIGFHDMYSGAFCQYDAPEEHWAYWSRFITVNRCVDPPKPVYKHLMDLIKDKDRDFLTCALEKAFCVIGPVI